MGKKRRRQGDLNESDQLKRQRQHIEPAHGQKVRSETSEGVVHYEHGSEIPECLLRYFKQRYKIWSKWDEGIWMTDSAWYGVTQEKVAVKIAEHVAVMAPAHRSILIDAFCGVGGNTIAFALSGRWKRVYAIEKDAATLECARRNAEIYGVKDKITWFLGDCFELLGEGDGAIVGLRDLASEFGILFGSPPWGGPSYRAAEIFDLNAMQPYSFQKIVMTYNRLVKVWNMVRRAR